MARSERRPFGFESNPNVIENNSGSLISNTDCRQKPDTRADLPEKFFACASPQPFHVTHELTVKLLQFGSKDGSKFFQPPFRLIPDESPLPGDPVQIRKELFAPRLDQKIRKCPRFGVGVFRFLGCGETIVG